MCKNKIRIDEIVPMIKDILRNSGFSERTITRYVGGAQQHIRL